MNHCMTLRSTFFWLFFALLLAAACTPIAAPPAGEAEAGETPAVAAEMCGIAPGATVPPLVGSTCDLTRTTAPQLPYVDEGSLVDYETLRDAACVSLMDIDLAQTAIDYPQDVFWAFFVNFRVEDPGDPQVRYGCLRLYGRDLSNEPTVGVFAPVDYGGILIRCQVNGVVNFAPTSIDESSRPLRTAPHPELEGVAAQFDGSGHLECLLDVGAEALRLLMKGADFSLIPDAQDQGDVNTELQVMHDSPYHEFEYFTIAAVVEALEDEAPDHPVIFYQPLDSPSGGPLSTCGAPAAFSLPTVWHPNDGPLPNQTFWAQLDGVNYLPSCAIELAQCMFDPEERAHYLWTDFGLESNRTDFALQFAWRAVGALTQFCDEITPPVQQAKLLYWIGPAVLYIGYRPDTDERLHGSLLEVWFDPDNSVKPSSSNTG